MRSASTILLILLTGVVSMTASEPDAGKREGFDFAHRISPLLAKLGCSSAECHGGATGQGGFKLSLFADNPLQDYEAITHELEGRRLDLVDPSNSLLLKKPTRDGVKHKGGRLLRKGEFAHQELLSWIERGAPYQEGARMTLTGVELRPSEDGVSVHARFEGEAGGIMEKEVTQLARLTSSNEQVATVDASGAIRKIGSGETWIMARYGQYSDRFPVLKSFGDLVEMEEVDHPLDRVWLQRLGQLGLKPAQQASDSTWVRRLYIDLLGRPPGPFELAQFEQLPAERRVPDTVDKLIASPEFDQVFARHFASYFEIPEEGHDPRNATERNNRLRAAFGRAIREKQTIAGLTRSLLVDSSLQVAWKHQADPRDRAEYVGRTMLGMRLGCARCHNHPLDRWTNAEHLQFSAFFTDPRPAPGGEMMAGRFFLPEPGKLVPPRLLPMGGPAPDGKKAHQETVAWFVLENQESTFARNIANRIFGTLIGTPLVNLPDDHRLSNPAVHEPVMDLLTRRFVEGGTDFRKLVRFICTSRLYALSSDPPDPENLSGDPELKYMARREARSLSPEQFKRAVEFVLGVSIDRSAPPASPLARQLYVLNSGMIQAGLNTPGNQVEALFDFQPDPEACLVELYRLILCRNPEPEEAGAFLPMLKGADDIRGVGKDLAFALLASREFGSLR